MATRLNNKLATAKEQVLEAYRNGATLREIADVHGVSPGTVRNILISMEENLRPRGRRKGEDRLDPRILSLDSSDTFAAPVIEEGLSGYEGGQF